MRKIFWFEMASLDGYHETEQDSLDWHNVDGDFHDFALAQLKESDALLFGRKTYEMMAAFWPAEAGLSADPEIAEAMNALPKVLVSGTLATADWAPVTIISRAVDAELARLKAQPGGDIALIGSSALAAHLLGAGLLDELRVMLNPVVLGHGHPLLEGASRTQLSLTHVREFRSGNVLLTYEPRPAAESLGGSTSPADPAAG
jgi:dihydrofolate reductase